MSYIELNGIHKYFEVERKNVLKDISLRIHHGEMIAIMVHLDRGNLRYSTFWGY
ncbi:hypothetical protein [Paenibacillus pini]|uniref:Uncharacterized protein n=1 Tax=Paenibacillus pini JCM 16418 TaxID=1236976 RepID=W7YUN2_9BACL|nr:hypothetical protein [Paenibacillus pini]GAF08281.1 hypothetical protein JCM16418_2347 [Paenibacillus pini JCM 16418]